MAVRPQPAHIKWPFDEKTAEGLEKNFRTLFQDTKALFDGVVPVEKGGTGQTDFDAGDILYAPSDGVVDGLPITATAGRFLRSTGSLPAWSTLVLPNTATTGDLLYASASNVMSMLADVATGNALISGGVGVAPSWGKIGLTTHVTGVLPVANGGTGTGTAFTPGSVVFAGSSGIYTQDNTNFFWDDTNNRLGIGTPSPSLALHVLSDADNVAVFEGLDHALAFIQGTSGSERSLNFTTNLAAGLQWKIGLDNLPSAEAAQFAIKTTNNVTAEFLFHTAGNAYVGTAAFVGSGSKGLIFGDGTALGTLGSNTAGLYAEDVSGTVKLYGIDEDGVTGQLAKLSGNLTAGSVVFKGSAGLLTEDNANFFWDDTNNRLGIRTTTPGTSAVGSGDYLVHGVSAADSASFLTIENTNGSGTAAAAVIRAISDNAFLNFQGHGTGRVISRWGVTLGGWTELLTGGAGNLGLAIGGLGNTPLIFGTVSAAVLSISGTNTSKQNVMIGAPYTSEPGTGHYCLIFADGTAPSSLASNTAGAYADDVGGTVELFGVNEAGNIAQLTGLNIRKTADESVTNSTTHQADDHLTVNLAASSSYAFEIWGFWTTAGATAGITVQLDGTVGVSSIKADIAIIDYTTNVFAAFGRVTAFNSAVGAGLTGDNSFYIKGCIETTTAGTLFLEWAQNTADVVNATTLQENSYFILRKLNA